jgi:WhiB family redox-sensing transcriptional regulator
MRTEAQVPKSSHGPPGIPGSRAITNDSTQMTWRSNAACLGSDPDLFFITHPGRRGGVALGITKPAMRLCSRCPVTGECLSYAMATPEGKDFGIWGGMTERLRLRRTRISYS